MKLRLIPPGEFLMGSTDEQVAAALKNATEAKAMQVALDRIQLAERPQHRVVISRPFHFGATEVTNAEFRKFVEATQYVTDAEKFGFGDDGETQSSDKVKEEQKKLTWRTPGYPITDELPVTQVSWNDALAYCRWLSMQEQAVYRMPTEAEWEYACRAGTTTHYSFGDDVPALEQFGWYVGNTHGKPEAAGAKPANGFGLHDMHGNLFEWCQDIFDETWYQRSPNVDPPGPATGPASGTYYVVRGGFWGGSAPLCRSAFRINHTAAYRHRSGGFRVVREVLSPPVPAKAPFDAAQARLHQEQWAAFLQLPVEYVNRHGMKFRLIPPGEFSMGSSPAEVDAALAGIPEDDLHWKEVVRSEAPQHTVVLTRPFYLGLTEVTQAQYQKLIGTNPAYFSAQGEGKAAVAGLQTDQHPVERVTVQQIKAFCERFNESESLTTLATVPSDTTGISTVGGYRLPTEAEWEFACRAGTTTKYWSGESVADLERVGWIDSNSDRRPHPVGTLPANPFGLFDVHGNVWEWVADGGKSDSNRRTGLEREVDPFHPPLSGGEQLIRGGVTYLTPEYCRSASRHAFNPTIAYKDVGFRLAISIEGVRKSLAAQPQSANSPSDDR